MFALKILVGKTFKAWAVDGDRNALVMFHDSSREGTCKEKIFCKQFPT